MKKTVEGFDNPVQAPVTVFACTSMSTDGNFDCIGGDRVHDKCRSNCATDFHNAITGRSDWDANTVASAYNNCHNNCTSINLNDKDYVQIILRDIMKTPDGPDCFKNGVGSSACYNINKYLRDNYGITLTQLHDTLLKNQSFMLSR